MFSVGATATPKGFFTGGYSTVSSITYNCERDEERLDSCPTSDEGEPCDGSVVGVICGGVCTGLF